ncbi:sensor histidine kinase [Flavobacterium sp. FlaQc-52]|jgi:signal transduction histidine kinase|uniref:histidine kinase n=1 Tax=Flavobacterium cupriresistens TaxID=2893885 RepID=A0ABU4R7W2_9FLAO|nr:MULTISPECIES: HAMP domain-containing sensor histidine kinase [unclassified Flavobacterium]MDX6188682.1 HAMP domain-containing sensor histidine kinase [Flavobacterium sp. Fl-318]UFH44530.1 HAMP domain-containing histidine kinase [Flavobacterium sp. F-323]
MLKGQVLKNLRFPNVFILLLIVFISCALLICINFFTIKILSANRAYVNGESHYSKGQKDASRHLITYLYTREAEQWKLYNEELKVPQGDGIARKTLLKAGDNIAARKGFLTGRNHKEDIDDLVWLFIHFKEIPFLAKAIHEWEQGDQLIDELYVIGTEINAKVKRNILTLQDQQKYLLQISQISDKLTINERNFSNTLGEGTRKIKTLLTITNIFFILVIICSVSCYYSIMVRRLLTSKKEIEVKNENLLLVNHELDRFVYSASHDLRSPITSLQGLIEITQLEDNIHQIRDYLTLMHQSLTRQDQFISDIIDYSKNKRKLIIIEPVSLQEIFNEAIAQLMHIENANRIEIKKELLIDEIQSDGLRLKIIISNLLSNAIKYADSSKQEMFISIKTYISDGFNKIEIADNGIGIKDEFKEHIFEMYFGTNKNKGSGLGLYIVKEAVENIKGTIFVSSENSIGSKFIVTIPNSNGT